MRIVAWLEQKPCHRRPISNRGKIPRRRRECPKSHSSRVQSLTHQAHQGVITLLPDDCRRAEPQPIIVFEIGGRLLTIHAALREDLREVRGEARQRGPHPMGLIELLAGGNKSEVGHRTPVVGSEVGSAVVARRVEVGICQGLHHRPQSLITSERPQAGHRRHPLRHGSFGPSACSLLLAWCSPAHIRIRLVPRHGVVHRRRRMHGVSDRCQPRP